MIHRICIGLILIAIAVSCNTTQKVSGTKNELWTFTSSKEIEQKDLMPKDYLTLELNDALLGEKLSNSTTPQITLPTLDRSFITVKLEDSGTMSPALATKFPNIKSFKGEQVGNNITKVRIDKNAHGVFAMIVAEGQTYFINPLEKGSSIYIIYNKQNAVKGGNPFVDKLIK